MDIKLDKQYNEDFERSLGFLLQDVARLMRLVFDRQIRDVGLTRTQWFVLAHVIRTDGQRQTDLAHETDMEKAPLGKLVDRLEDGDWIERRPDPVDRRAKRIYKTSKVDPLIPLMLNTAASVYKSALDGLPDNTQDHLIDDLIAIKKNLQSKQCNCRSSGRVNAVISESVSVSTKTSERVSDRIGDRGFSRAHNPMPSFILDALKEKGLMQDYANRPPYQQKNYIGWVMRAKREGTRQKRLTRMLDELEHGNKYMKLNWRPRRG